MRRSNQLTVLLFFSPSSPLSLLIVVVLEFYSSPKLAMYALTHLIWLFARKRDDKIFHLQSYVSTVKPILLSSFHNV